MTRILHIITGSNDGRPPTQNLVQDAAEAYQAHVLVQDTNPDLKSILVSLLHLNPGQVSLVLEAPQTDPLDAFATITAEFIRQDGIKEVKTATVRTIGPPR